MRMEPVVEDLPGEFDALQAEARAEGHQFLDRLANEWASGAMRFQQPGEQLLAVYSKIRWPEWGESRLIRTFPMPSA